MRVVVRSVMHVAKALGARKVETELPEESDIMDLLHQLSVRYGDQFRKMIFKDGDTLHRGIIIMLNGRSILAYAGTKCGLKEGDDVLIMPLVAGG